MANGFKIVLVAGLAATVCSGAESPTTLQAERAQIGARAHLYYNAVTGERLVTLPGQTAAADAGPVSESIWASLVGNPCASEGFTTEYYFAVDDASGTTSLATAVTVMDMGDIATDTVVDCLHINWTTSHIDTDTDGDGVGDGVEGLAGQWTIWDRHNARPECAALPLTSFVFTDLPGNIAGTGPVSAYSVDVDLVGFGTATDLSFEIGDSDGDCQSAAFCNNDVDTDGDGIGDGVSIANVDWDHDGLPDSDIDGDGLFDWTWSVRFFQPGTTDFDDDGVLDGVPPAADADVIGISFGAPEGTAIDNGDGTWTWEIDTSVPDAGTGQEDLFAIYSPPNPNGDSVHAGMFNFGGFACVDDGNGGYTPPAMFEFQLFGPGDGECCPYDLNCDGVLNFFDISLFIQQHQDGGDYNGDGASDFFDISAFVQDFNTGCP